MSAYAAYQRAQLARYRRAALAALRPIYGEEGARRYLRELTVTRVTARATAPMKRNRRTQRPI